jgi:hypothetical protein
MPRRTLGKLNEEDQIAMNKIVVCVENGKVASQYSSNKDIKIVIVDYDDLELEMTEAEVLEIGTRETNGLHFIEADGPEDPKGIKDLFTDADLEEILYAIEYKIDSPAVAGDNKWKGHLRSIYERIETLIEE